MVSGMRHDFIEEQSDTNTMVYCKDCKYYYRTFGMWMAQTEARCTRGSQPKVNLVTGKVAPLDYYNLERCSRERTNEYKINCGEEGRFWSPRKPSPETTMLMLKRKVPNDIVS